MNILLATPDVSSAAGGPAYSVPAIANNLYGAGHRVGIVAMRGLTSLSPSIVATPLDIVTADVFHNFGAWTTFNHAVVTGARIARKPVVYAPIGMLEPWALEQKQLKKKIGLWLYQRQDLQRAAVLHATASDEAEHLRALAPSTPIAVIPHGIDLPDPIEVGLHPPHASESRMALFMSRIHPKKGLLELVRAWARVRPAGWRLVIAGPDESGHRAEVEAEIELLRLRPQVTFVGQVRGAAKRDLLRRAELFVLPTFSENFGIAVAEALASGLPVLTTRAAPWRELVERGCGWWIETGMEALAEALRIALGRTSIELSEMGERGVRLIQERYSWSSRVTMYGDLYRWLTGGPRPNFVNV